MGNRHVRFWRPVASARTVAEFNHFLGAKQRCWAHLVRELKALRDEHVADTTETGAWAEGILSIYAQASRARPPPEEGCTPQAIRAREERARQCEALILLLCPSVLDSRLPYATLAKRLRTHLPELFTFVREPWSMPPTTPPRGVYAHSSSRARSAAGRDRQLGAQRG